MENGLKSDGTKPFRRHVEDFLNRTEVARQASERARDYVNHKQWTDDEAAELRRRKQAPIVVNRIHPKVEGLKGLLIERRTDPKAFPRTKAHEEVSHAITDALRYVADNVDFDETKLAVADSFFVEGYGGAIVEIRDSGGEPEVQVTEIPWDRIYFDPHSRKNDFSDSRYFGVFVWMDLDDARAMFGDAVDLIEEQGDNETGTFEDRPKWVDGAKERRRIRIATEYFRQGFDWHFVAFSGSTVLRGPEPSPYLDEDGKPSNPIELVSAHIDRENRRFGEVKYWLDLQDEVNKRRSKALHLNSQRQTASRKGAIDDVPGLKRELAKPDGHVEYIGDKGDFEVLNNGDMTDAQLLMMQDAKSEIDAVGFNAQLAGERQGNLSGKAILALQGAGSNELSNLFSRLNGWEKRIYRQVWRRVRQFWTREKWIRVTDQQRNLRWVGFNVPMTIAAQLEEIAEDESREEQERAQAAQVLQAMTEAQDPRLQQVTEVRNEIAELDVDVILDQSLDSINVQNEQFQMLASLAETRPEVPFTTLLELSNFRDKDELKEEIEKGQKAAAEAAQAQTAAALEAEQASARVELEKEATLQAQKINAERQSQAIAIEAKREEMELASDLKRQEAALTQAVDAARAQAARPQEIQIPDAARIAQAMESLAGAKDAEAEGVDELLEELRRPLEVVRDDNGLVVGLR